MRRIAFISALCFAALSAPAHAVELNDIEPYQADELSLAELISGAEASSQKRGLIYGDLKQGDKGFIAQEVAKREGKTKPATGQKGTSSGGKPAAGTASDPKKSEAQLKAEKSQACIDAKAKMNEVCNGVQTPDDSKPDPDDPTDPDDPSDPDVPTDPIDPPESDTEEDPDDEDLKDLIYSIATRVCKNGCTGDQTSSKTTIGPATVKPSSKTGGDPKRPKDTDVIPRGNVKKQVNKIEANIAKNNKQKEEQAKIKAKTDANKKAAAAKKAGKKSDKKRGTLTPKSAAKKK